MEYLPTGQSANVTPRFLTVAGAAIYTSLSVTSIRREIAAGHLHAYRPRRGRILIDRTELDALVLSARRRSSDGRGLWK